MSRRNREQVGSTPVELARPPEPPPRRPTYQPPQGSNVLLTVAMSALVLTSGLNWLEMRQLNRAVDEKLDRIATSIDRVGTKVESSARNVGASAAPNNGPDPNKVYAIRTDHAPAKGPASAPVVIAEFSDFQ